MEGNPLVAAVAFAGLAGGVGFALFTILPDAYRAARMPVAIVAVLIGGISGWQKFGGLEPSPAELERQLFENEEIGPALIAFKRADPLSFAAYIEHIRAAASDDAGRDAARLQAALTLQAAAEARLGARPPEDVATYYQLTRAELLELRDVRPATCRPLFFGDHSVELVEPSPALRQRRFALYERAFGPISASPPAPMSDEEFDAAMAAMFAQTAEIVGADADLLSLDTDATGREARACEVLAELVNQIAQSPDAARIFLSARRQSPQPS